MTAANVINVKNNCTHVLFLLFLHVISTLIFVLASRCIPHVEGAEGPWDVPQVLRHSDSIKTLPFPTFHRILYCILSTKTQRRTLPHYQSEEMKLLNISLPQMGIELTIRRTHRLAFIITIQKIIDKFYHKEIFPHSYNAIFSVDNNRDLLEEI